MLFLYHNDTGVSLPASSVTVDNARFSVFGASQRNQLPVISDVLPVTSSPFLPASTEISFTVTDDQLLDSGAIQVTLNGVEFTTANGLKVTGEDKSRTVVLGGLRDNQTYHAVLSVEDSEGESETRDLFFDTLDKASFVIEVEDYNFNAGEYLDERWRSPSWTRIICSTGMTTHTLPRRAIWTSITSTRMKSSICHTPVSP